VVHVISKYVEGPFKVHGLPVPLFIGYRNHFFFFFNIYPKYREMDHCLDQFLIICLYYLHCILVLDFLLGSPILRIKL
jgi:hypothetical protein